MRWPRDFPKITMVIIKVHIQDFFGPDNIFTLGPNPDGVGLVAHKRLSFAMIQTDLKGRLEVISDQETRYVMLSFGMFVRAYRTGGGWQDNSRGNVNSSLAMDYATPVCPDAVCPKVSERGEMRAVSHPRAWFHGVPGREVLLATKREEDRRVERESPELRILVPTRAPRRAERERRLSQTPSRRKAGERSRAALHRRERDWWPVVSCGRRALSRYGQCGLSLGPIMRHRRHGYRQAAAPLTRGGSDHHAARRSLAGHPSSATRGPYPSSATVGIILPAYWSGRVRSWPQKGGTVTCPSGRGFTLTCSPLCLLMGCCLGAR
ncbi:hypothetical protein HPB48_016312 [Haemaphysalis longicornis]|uniref:Uncharacterized protein n=1 Tax=Haemaphysalis longicornis TaxID=44386 RepID=A0A9J6GUM4_HAELO|nr:hypothetical protein HPB48_016312 [Haemaphysalis longicornis]